MLIRQPFFVQVDRLNIGLIGNLWTFQRGDGRTKGLGKHRLKDGNLRRKIIGGDFICQIKKFLIQKRLMINHRLYKVNAEAIGLLKLFGGQIRFRYFSDKAHQSSLMTERDDDPVSDFDVLIAIVKIAERAVQRGLCVLDKDVENFHFGKIINEKRRRELRVGHVSAINK